MLEHAVRYLQRMVERGEPRKAWALMKECLVADDRFRPGSDETLLSLTRSANREDAGLVNQLLEDFHQIYPDSPLAAEAMFRRARVCIELLTDGTTGLKLMRTIANNYPDFAATQSYQRYRARLKLN